jgi:hypothetical protein
MERQKIDVRRRRFATIGRGAKSGRDHKIRVMTGCGKADAA